MTTDDETTRPKAPPLEVPEADAAEQAIPAGEVRPAATPTVDLEVPEADALEQAAEVPFDADDDYDRMLDARTDED